MLATIMPFACMGLGLLIGFQKRHRQHIER